MDRYSELQAVAKAAGDTTGIPTSRPVGNDPVAQEFNIALHRLMFDEPN